MGDTPRADTAGGIVKHVRPPSDDRLSETLRGASGSFAIKVTSAGLLFISQLIFARLLGVEGYGVFVLTLACLNMVLLVGRLGFDIASVRFVSVYFGSAKWNLLRGFLNFSYMTTFIASVLGAVALAGGAWLFRESIGAQTVHALWLAGATIPLFAILQINEATLRGLRQIVRSLIPQAILHPLVLIAAFPACIFLLGAQANARLAMGVYLGATAASFVAVSLMLWRALPPEARAASPDYRGAEWLKTATSMILLMGFGMILNQTTTVMVGSLIGTAEAGLFGAATRIANLLQFAIVVVNATLAPQMADLYARSETAELRRIVTFGARLTFAAALTIAIAVLLLGKWILMLMGEEFVAAWPSLVVLALGQLFFAATGPAAMLLNMTGHQMASSRILALSVVVNLAFCAALIPAFGVMGAAISVAVTTVLWCSLMAITATRRLGILPVVTIPRRRR